MLWGLLSNAQTHQLGKLILPVGAEVPHGAAPDPGPTEP